ncbi:hypothetical protein [Methylobacterium mesophilicum]|uniref:hypothetical protein n=1 Tax=Methylobacterium mesophilicum TaxID=39956 RepID=UPI0013037418|nr:hypothetical protein [Methylobacterium mesophilicum]
MAKLDIALISWIVASVALFRTACSHRQISVLRAIVPSVRAEAHANGAKGELLGGVLRS